MWFGVTPLCLRRYITAVPYAPQLQLARRAAAQLSAAACSCRRTDFTPPRSTVHHSIFRTLLLPFSSASTRQPAVCSAPACTRSLLQLMPRDMLSLDSTAGTPRNPKPVDSSLQSIDCNVGQVSVITSKQAAAGSAALAGKRG